MQTITYTLVCSNLSSAMQKVCDVHTSIVVTRAGTQPVVIISVEDFEALEET